MSASAFLQGVHHSYAQTDGSYAWPNTREGDLLREAVDEIERLAKDAARYRWLLDHIHGDGYPCSRCYAQDISKPMIETGEQLDAAIEEQFK